MTSVFFVFECSVKFNFVEDSRMLGLMTCKDIPLDGFYIRMDGHYQSLYMLMGAIVIYLMADLSPLILVSESLPKSS
jgi:hypothetical protein